MQTKPIEKLDFLTDENDFYKNVVNDIKSSLIQFISERGWGKSTSLKNIIKRCKESDPNIQFVVADTSQSWYKKSPLTYRQLVTREKMKANQIKSVPDCVYEIGSLTEAERRAFLGIIIKQQYDKRYQLSLTDPKAFEALPFFVLVVEEANVIFSSYSMRRNDWITPVLQDFVSVGRNYKMSAFLVATVEDGEISPSLRRRSRRIYGKLVAEGDIARVRRTNKMMAEYLSTKIPRFNFMYWGDRFYGPIYVKDTVTETPADYVAVAEPGQGGSSKSLWFIQFLIGAAIMLLFYAYFF